MKEVFENAHEELDFSKFIAALNKVRGSNSDKYEFILRGGNDLHKAILYSNVIHFPDDTSLITKHKSLKKLRKLIERLKLTDFKR